MKSFFNKITSGIAAAFLLLAGAVMAGIGLTVFAFVALAGFAAFGVALLVAPFMSLATVPGDSADDAPEMDARVAA